MWDSIHGTTEQWAPSLVTACLTIVLVIVVHRVMRSQAARAASGRRGLFWRPLAVFVLGTIGLVSVILTLPVGDATRGQMLSLLGLLSTATIALSATTFLGNAMAGLMLKSIRSFHLGDYLQVGEHTGRVSEQGLLHTEIQTEDRDLTTLPNLYLVTHAVKVVRSSGTILSASVSLGYENSWPLVERLLNEAASSAGLVEPFTQISELGDYSVTYRACGLLQEVKHLMSARSRLRGCMLDVLHLNGIEIVSPTFMNQRTLTNKDRFFPYPAATRPEARDSPMPEDLIFDKANAAEATAERQAELEVALQAVDELGTAILNNKGEATVELERELLEAERRRDELRAQLESVEVVEKVET